YSMSHDKIDCSAMIGHVKPIANVESLSVNRNRLFRQRRSYHCRNEFLCVLIRTVVIGAVGHSDRQTIRVMICVHEMVRAGLARGIRRVRRIRSALVEWWIFFAEASEDFVG